MKLNWEVSSRVTCAVYCTSTEFVLIFDFPHAVSPDQLPPSAPPDGVERRTLEKGYGRVRFHPVLAGTSQTV